jgi:hypothetical protein
MKTFHEFLEAKVLGSGLGDKLKSRGKEAIRDGRTELATGLAMSVPSGGMSLVGAAGSLTGTAAKFAAGAVSDGIRAWRENSAVKQAMALATKTVSSRYGKEIAEKILSSYNEVPDELLSLLSEGEVRQIADSLLEAVKSGKVQDWHSKKLAVEILKRKASEIQTALRYAGNMPNLRLSGVV